MWQQGSLVQLEVVDLTSNGCGVGRLHNRMVFIPNSVPGDVLSVRLLKVKPSYAEGQLVTILQSSKHRIRPRCFVADKCGGCQWQHIDYDTQITFKQKQVTAALQRLNRIEDVTVQPTLASDPFGYRNRAIYPLGRSSTGSIKAGYYQKGTHRIININQCPVQDPQLDVILTKIKVDLNQWEIYDALHQTGALRYLSLRIGQRTGEVLMTIVSTTEELPGMKEQSAEWLKRFPNVMGVCLNINASHSNRIFGDRTMVLQGKGTIIEQFCSLEFCISSTAFFQVHTRLAEMMVESMMEMLQLKGNETIIDGYTGIGTMILPIAHAHPTVTCIGIDSHKESIRCAEANAQRNGIENVHFHVGKFEDVLPSLEVSPDVVLLDPPRKGCDTQVLKSLMKIHPHRIIYVSCKPATLARDVDILCHSGTYILETVLPVDLFPQTSHTESLTLLKLNQ